MCRFRFDVALCFGLLAGLGCAPPPASKDTTVRSYKAAPRVAAGSPSRARLRGPHPAGVTRYRSGDLPGGITCLLRLETLGVKHRKLAARGQMITPIEIIGPIRGVRFRPTGKRRLICDCRFALALYRAAPLFSKLELGEVIYSNAYSRRRPGPGKLSRHDMGLAIDVHRFRSNGRMLRVEDDFRRGASLICDEAPTPLNEFACRAKEQRVFDRVLTPDTDAAHYNHFHLAIVSLDRRRYRRKRRPPPVIAE